MSLALASHRDAHPVVTGRAHDGFGILQITTVPCPVLQVWQACLFTWYAAAAWCVLIAALSVLSTLHILGCKVRPARRQRRSTIAADKRIRGATPAGMRRQHGKAQLQ